MKLTKPQLKQIIKEEFQKALNERGFGEGEPAKDELSKKRVVYLEGEEEEPIDLNTLGPNEAFGLAWSKAIELLKDRYPDAARELATMSGGAPETGEEESVEEGKKKR